MRRRNLLLIIGVVLVALGYIATLNIGNENNSQSLGTTGPNKPIGNDTDNNIPDPIQTQIKAMSLEEKVGQLVMVGVNGYENDANSRQLIKKYQVSGFVLLKQNVKNANQMLALINSLKETNSVNKIPLFLAIDEEGGRVSRIPDELMKIPASRRIGDLHNSGLSYQLGSIIGEELRSFGLNMNFAPVLDVNSNPKNQVIGDRAFGDEPSVVRDLGVQTMKGLQSQNIISVVKHFPGHGDTSVDSHLGLPTVNHDIARLKSLEFVPFAAAIDNNVDAIMMAHILLPKIDTDNPASFSLKIISEILRRDLNFAGVVITDDITMGAIVNNYNIGEVAVKSIKAGSDIVLICHDYLKEEAVIKAIQKAAESGEISMDRIEQSVYRVLSLKLKYALSDGVVSSVDLQPINNKIKALYRDFPSLKG
ncbi:beta-N-acetylhexosaminidase [Desulfosporosinus fructosivorans]|uniref:beta-N-acetylhexosaminidase n=1 Tax=Desulfosporosinus fructosivorans TaxID=2018669 RepID=A0A4Z0R7H3_9FIRM|nr:beta-N-acetylhexosaminidase [Desulfosporosinus fructosivorans]TGE39131.1 beta-N-acetylhexosaminidase [Desulfosporosinus fructosivorans]